MKQGFSITLQPTKQSTIVSTGAPDEQPPPEQKEKIKQSKPITSKIILRMQKSLKKYAADETLYDYSDRTADNKYNFVLNILNIIFGVVFLIEAVMKIVAFGFVLHPESYMRSPLNILDFSLVLIGLFEMIYFLNQQPYNSQLSILRGLRVLRPLKIVNAMPRMRKIFNTLIASLNQLVSVFIFILYLFILFGLLGVQLFQGAYQHQCLQQSTGEFSLVPQPNLLCDINNFAGATCPSDQFCGDHSEQNGDQSNRIFINPNLEYGMGNFDNFAQALISVFQIISQDNVGIKLMPTNWKPIVVLYFVTLILLGSYFALKIILAVIILAFKKMQHQKELEEQQRLRELEIKRKKRVVEALQTISRKVLKDKRGSIFEVEDFSKQIDIVRESPERQGQSPPSTGSGGANTLSSRSDKSLKSENSPPNNEPPPTFFKLSDGGETTEAQRALQEVPKLNYLGINESDGQENIFISPIITQKVKTLEISTGKHKDKIKKQIKEQRKLQILRKRTLNLERQMEFQEIKNQVNNKLEKKSRNLLTVQNAEEYYTKLIRQSVMKAYQQHQLAKSIEGFEYENDKEELAQSIRHEILEQFQRKNTFEKMSQSHQKIIQNKYKIEQEIEKSKLDLEMLELEDRNEDRTLYTFFYYIISHKFFTIFINASILLNAIILSLDSSYNSLQMDEFLKISNMVFTGIFLIEMIVKLIGLGIKLYFKDKFNIFDFILVIVSLVDISLQFTLYKSREKFSAIRAFRIFRLFKLAKSWVQLQNIITIIYQTLQDLSAFGILLLTFIFTYTLVGMEWFAYKVQYNKQGELDFENGTFPDANFNTFYQSFYIVFEVLTTDAWSEKYFRYYKHSSPTLASIFFITLLTFGQYILLMLFIAILIENFDESSINQAQKEREKVKKKKSMIIWVKNSFFKGIYSKMIACKRRMHKRFSVSESQEVPPQSKFKKLVSKIVQSKYFDYTILGLILLSTLIFTIENPLSDPESTYARTLEIFDWVISFLFVLEIIMKGYAYGLYFNGPKSYLKSWFNIIDVLIVLISIISLSTPYSYFSTFKILRICRVLRPIRLISTNASLRTSIGALVRVMPNIINILLIALLLLFIFAIMALNIFKGLFYYCHSEQSESLTGFSLLPFQDKWDCINVGGEYLTYDSQFNNIQHALAAIMKICQAFNWTQIMLQSTRIKGYNMIPEYNGNPSYAMFFVIFMTFSYFFITNLFVGVLVSSFNREKEKLGQKYLLTDDQFKWLQTKLIVLQAKPKFFLIAPENKLRKLFYKISIHKKFDQVILVCILLNTLTLCLEYFDQSPIFKEVLLIINMCFSCFFVLEVLIKIMGFGKRYFKENWNIFDFVVSFLQLAANLIEFYPNLRGLQMAGIRIFRSLKFFHIFRKTNKINIIFQTFISTLPALLNVGSLLLLMFYIFAVLAQKLFAEVKLAEPLNENLNFQGVGNSLLSMFLMSNGDIFYQIAQAVTNEHSVLYQCIENPSYEDYKRNGYKAIGCGNKAGGFTIFFLFAIIVLLIFINIFIAIIIQSYEDTSEKSHKVFNEDLCEQFREVWSHYDKDASGFILIEDLPDLMLELGPPLGWDQSYKDNQEKQESFIHQLHFPTYNDTTQFSFMDVIENLVLMRIVNHEVHELLKNEEDYQDNLLIEQKITKSVNMIGRLKEAEQNDNIEIVNQVQKNKTKQIRIDQDSNNSLNKQLMKMKLTSKLSYVNASTKRSAGYQGSPPRKVFEIKEDEVQTRQVEKNSEFDSFQFELSEDLNSESQK